MIRRISLKNFQSHKDTELVLHGGFNVIAGWSDVGKTAIVRALRWLVFNRPSGDSFRSWWGGDTLVEMELDSGMIVGRRRTASKNEYYLRGPDGEERTFSGFGASVPEPVQEALRGLGGLNFGTQFDGPFLLSSSPGEVARVLNQSVGLDEIDRALSTAALFHRQHSSKLQVAEESVQEYEVELEELDWLDVAQRDLERASKAEGKVVSLHQRVEGLHQLLSDIWRASEDVEAAQAPASFFEQVRSVDAEVLKIRSDFQRMADLGVLRDRIKQHQVIVGRLEGAVILREHIEGAYSDYQQLYSVQRKMRELEGALADVATTRDAWEIVEAEFREQMGEACPLCGAPEEAWRVEI